MAKKYRQKGGLGLRTCHHSVVARGVKFWAGQMLHRIANSLALVEEILPEGG